MSFFSFDFLVTDDNEEQNSNPKTLIAEEINDEKTVIQHDFVKCNEVKCPAICMLEDSLYDFAVHEVGDIVFKEAVGDWEEKDNDFDEDCDIIPGKYEGGFKIWECSKDLAKIISEKACVLPDNPKTVLELGCGHGIPGIISMVTFEDLTDVIFSDFNSEVLESTTWPNLVLNCPQKLEIVRCLAGDWTSLSLQIEKFDLILSAETLYTVESCRKVFEMIESHLEPNGVALIASKKYYFGVGGGTFDLENLASRSSSTLKYSLVKAFEDGQSNIREVIKLVKK